MIRIRKNRKQHHSKSTRARGKRILVFKTKTRLESANMKEKKTGKSATREEFGRKWRIRFNELVILLVIGRKKG